MNRMVPIIAALLLAATPAENEAALADRAKFPVAEHGYCYYLSTGHLPGELKDQTEAALAFVVASCSRQPIVEKCTPVGIADGLYRIRLDELKWDWRLWIAGLKNYPYSRAPGDVPLVIRADWLIIQLSDTTESKLHYQLLYGRDDLNRDDLLKFWGANNDAASHFGVVARSKAANGPAVSGLRLVENRPTANRGTAWGTSDSATIDTESDPLEHLDNRFKFDAQEWLVANPKQSLATGKHGSLLAAWLNDGNGKRQEEAPPSIVTDHHGFRGQRAIRNWGGCVSCHTSGINDPGVSEVRTFIQAGVDIYAKPKALQEQIESYHLTDAAKQVKRDQEDWEVAIKMVNGLDGELNAVAFAAAIDAYDANVTLESAAAELDCEPKELRLALAYASNGGAKLGARLAGLAHEQPMSRKAWEQNWYQAYLALQAWRTK